MTINFDETGLHFVLGKGSIKNPESYYVFFNNGTINILFCKVKKVENGWKATVCFDDISVKAVSDTTEESVFRLAESLPTNEIAQEICNLRGGRVA